METATNERHENVLEIDLDRAVDIPLPVLKARDDLDVIAARSSPRTASSSSSGATRLTSPHSSAVPASMNSPVINNSKAFLRGRFRLTGTAGVEQNRPTLMPEVAKRALSAATARSQEATSWQPAAVAMPCTRAMTTWGI